jgi:hypothetical protein
MRKLSAAGDPHKANFQVDEQIGIGAAVADSDFGQPACRPVIKHLQAIAIRFVAFTVWQRTFASSVGDAALQKAPFAQPRREGNQREQAAGGADAARSDALRENELAKF